MINKINFTGTVFQAGSVKHLSKSNEIKKIQNYANAAGVDVFLLQRDYYVGGAGKYDAILVKTDKSTGQNAFAEKEFDFVKCPNPKFNEGEVEYMPKLRELYV